MVIHLCLTPLCYVFSKQSGQFVIHKVSPYSYGPCPVLYGCFLFLSALALVFVVVACWRMRAICANFCSRE